MLVVKEMKGKFIFNWRKKWEKSFEGVSVVLFVTSLNDYDLLCYEDDKTNRLQESLSLFDQIANGDWFKNSLIMLIMNKVDLFKTKVSKVPLKNFYDDYEGGDDFEKGIAYIENKFRDLNKYEKDRIFSFRSQATNSETVKKILGDVTKTVIGTNLFLINNRVQYKKGSKLMLICFIKK
jgi:hypothetical protein